MAITEETASQKNLSADALFGFIHKAFQKIPDYRPPLAEIPLSDALMSAFAMFSLDGTGDFSSSEIHCEPCLEKTSKSGKVTYSHQMLGAAIVHPDIREAIPFMPEPIIKQNGQQKNDCERNAAKRFLKKLRIDHPHLKLIVIEDGLSSNAPHIRDILRHNMHLILTRT